jgi:acetyl-CoA carboxylase carboxyltransferase component
MATKGEQLKAIRDKILQMGPEHHRKRVKEKYGKLLCRERLDVLLDPGSIVEDGLMANCLEKELAADGVVTVLGKIGGRDVAVMANDFSVKAGSWGERTVEKIIRIQETAMRLRIPMIYLVDSAGLRITDQIYCFPGRRHAGRIFHLQALMSGMVPQICLLSGPSAAGGAYIPTFCDAIICVNKLGAMYLGSPRMAEVTIGEKVSLEEMGGALMHCSISGVGDVFAEDEEGALQMVKDYLSYFPQHCFDKVPRYEPAETELPIEDIESIIPENQNAPFDMYEVIWRIIDKGSWFEMKKLWAQEIITGFARLNGKPLGIIANQPKVKGGVLFVDSADKACRFIRLCDAFNIPLLYLMDVPGFMIGSVVEKQGILRHGCKMLYAVSEATVPKISVVVRKAYGAGLYAMCGPSHEPDACLALPGAMVAVMGPEAAVNAVHHNHIQEIKDPKERMKFIMDKQKEYREQVDIYKLAANLVVDDMVLPICLREELIRRFAYYENKPGELRCPKKHGVMQV